MNLSALVICRAVSLSLEYGNTDASCTHYAWLGRISAGRFGDYQAADKFGRLACDLVDRGKFSRFRAPVYLAIGGNVIPWTKPLRDGRVLIRRALEAAVSIGDVLYEAYSLLHLTSNMMMAGDPLKDVQSEIEKNLATIRNRKVQFAADAMTAQLAIIRTMRGLTRSFGSFDDQQFDELDIERSFEHSPEQSPSETRLLDPQTSGAVSSRRLCCGYWCSLEGRAPIVDHANRVLDRGVSLLWCVVSLVSLRQAR
ncbi:hypothetical protein ACVWXN_006689 [Bradyrhizobium sp. i1.4.4]